MKVALSIAAIAILGGLIYYAANGSFREKALQDDIETTQDIKDAQTACPDSLPWFDRLQCLNSQ